MKGLPRAGVLNLNWPWSIFSRVGSYLFMLASQHIIDEVFDFDQWTMGFAFCAE